MLEKEIENNLLDYLSTLDDGFFWKNQNVGIYDPRKRVHRKLGKHQFKGIFDILGMWKGQFAAIEVKTKTGKMSKDQKNFMDKVIEKGGIAFKATCIKDVQIGLGIIDG